MARPRKKEADKRTEFIPPIRLTPNELVEVQTAAATLGQPVTQYARGMILNGQVVMGQGVDIDPALVLELKRIGNNLNQAVRQLHQTGELSPVIEDTAQRLGGFLDELIEKIL